MVRCEVCGREIRGPVFRRVIEGARMVVCEQCSRFGAEEWSVKPVAPPPRARAPRRDEVESAESLVPVVNYGRLVREGREKLGLDPDKFARLIGEKVSTVKMIEREELIPDQSIAQKLRRHIKVSVLVREVEREASSTPPPKGAPTIGDLLNLKEKKETLPKK